MGKEKSEKLDNSLCRQYCLVLSLVDDAELIRQYEDHHKPGNVWPAVVESIRDSGIEDMKIYRNGADVVMVISASPSFSFDAKIEKDRLNGDVQAWEQLMDRYQRVDRPDLGKKWQLISKIFDLKEHC